MAGEKRRARPPITAEGRQRLSEGQRRGWADPDRRQERRELLAALARRNAAWKRGTLIPLRAEPMDPDT